MKSQHIALVIVALQPDGSLPGDMNPAKARMKVAINILALHFCLGFCDASQSSIDAKIRRLQLQIVALQNRRDSLASNLVRNATDAATGVSETGTIGSIQPMSGQIGAGFGHASVLFENGVDALHAPERLAYIPRVLSKEECEYMIDKATPLFEGSMVMGTLEHSGDTRQQTTRSSFTAYFDDERDDPVIRRVVRRMHGIGMVPLKYGEDVQVTRYPSGTNYTLHLDSSPETGRLVTVLIFLRDVEEGGHTVFPRSRLTAIGRRKLDLLASGKYEALLRSDGIADSVEELDEAESWWDRVLGPATVRRPAQLHAEKEWKWRWAHRQTHRSKGGRDGTGKGGLGGCKEQEDRSGQADPDLGGSRSGAGIEAAAAPERLPPPPEPRLPKLGNTPQEATQADMAPFCGSRRVISVAPRAGDAIMWYSHRMQLDMDFNTLHGGCPPLNGEEKFIAQRWMRWYHPEDGNSMFRLLRECGVLDTDGGGGQSENQI